MNKMDDPDVSNDEDQNDGSSGEEKASDHVEKEGEGLAENNDDIDEESEDDDDDNDGDDDDENDGNGNGDDDDNDEAEDAPKTKDAKEKKKTSKVFGDKFLAQTENFNEKLKKRGVIYVARVPPRMTPTKVKSLLSDFGEVIRVYLVEEDRTVRARRKKQGGSGSKRFTEGWVEFGKKSVAKNVALSLNNTPITNYKRSPHYGDLWNLKYLNKFKWSHLTEKVAYERRVREQKLRVEMMQARRENASYVELVETGKKLDKIDARKRRRGEDIPLSKGDEAAKEKRSKRQNRPYDDKSSSASKKALLSSLV